MDSQNISERNRSLQSIIEDDENEDLQEIQYLSFNVENENYALRIMHIVEIIRLTTITPIPDMEDYIKGVINLRGRIIPVLDVRQRFGLPEGKYDDRTCVIIASIKNSEVGLIVDRVYDVIEIPDDQIEDISKVNIQRQHRFIDGIGKVGDDIKIILNINELIFETELEKLKLAS